MMPFSIDNRINIMEKYICFENKNNREIVKVFAFFGGKILFFILIVMHWIS